MDFEVSVSVVVPVYNSAAGLHLLIERLEPVLTACARQFEVILVNDGSHDGSWEAIGQLTERYVFVRGINLMRNYGQHNALLCGIRAARNQVVVTIDDDLQNPPEEIPKLLAKLAEGYDVVYGAPAREQHGLWRDLASQVTKIALQSAVGAETARHASAFRAFRTEVRGGFTNFQGPFVSIDVLLTWGASRFAAVTVRHDARRLGQSQYTLRKLIRHAFNMMTGFSVLPLQVASVAGFVFTVFGFLVLAFVIGTYFMRGGSVPGFPFLASLIAMFSGVQMFALGIIGEYLARMHFRMMDRPGYAVRQQTTVPVERATPRLVAGMHA
ncbi:MAG: glycosyltransferase family 2 protein [Bryobacteraceae bacterium]|jgi:glycosyltransferase involved in cell wall biosynthesis